MKYRLKSKPAASHHFKDEIAFEKSLREDFQRRGWGYVSEKSYLTFYEKGVITSAIWLQDFDESKLED